VSSYYPCVKNHASGYIFYVGLISQASTKSLQGSATLAAGDVQVSIDGGALANLGTLPVVTPASSKSIKVTLSQAEINGDNIIVIFADASGAEWCDLLVNIQTVPRRFDDLAYPATTGRSMVVDAAGLVDANVVKLGPTGSGTAQTARDVGASVVAASVSGSVAGDVAGKVLGGGASSMTAAGVRAVDGSGNAVAPAATALLNSMWTDTKAGYVDVSIASRATPAQVNDEVDSALNTAIPGSPTADSVNERIKAMDDKLPSSAYLKGSGDADGGMDTADKGDVNAEVVDCLNIDTYAEPGQEAPAATNTLVKKIGYLFKFLRNRISTIATTIKVYADDGTTVDQKSTISDDATTFERGEFGTGP